MSDPLRVMLVGATGLVGGAVIRRCVGRSNIAMVALARREIELPAGSRMEVMLADPAGWPEAIDVIGAQAVICALGTTWRQSGRSEKEFRAVDHDLVLDVARTARANGADRFVLVSSVGASAGARAFYLRTKGEVEEALGKMRFRRLDILRPGLLVGEREADRRIAERLGMLASPLANLFLHGERRKYRGISADTVAAAALQVAREKAAGRFVHHNDDLARLASRLDRTASPV